MFTDEDFEAAIMREWRLTKTVQMGKWQQFIALAVMI